MISIRKKLLRTILLVVFAVTLLLAIITYFSVREEMDEFYDENLKQVALTILNITPADHAQPYFGDPNAKLRGEEEYLTQVWHKGALQYSSHPHVNFPLQVNDGKGETQFEDSTWHYRRQSNGDTTVQLAQDLNERHSVVIEIYGYLLIPILIQFPILAFLIWVSIGYGLGPLSTISSLIKNRNPSFLAPLPSDDVPVEINVLVNELNALLARLKLALESQRQFTADAAHELRTPLTAVRLQLDILKRADDDKEAKAALATLEKGVLKSTRLVHQLLELARQEPENLELPFSHVNLARIVEECIEQAQPLSKAKGIRITPKIMGRPTVTGSAPKLAVMIGNLINNAVTYTNDKGRVEITLRQNGQQAILDIADNGIGIPPDVRTRIFDRFYRVPGTSAAGSGLGLSIVRNIVDLHKAKIEVAEGIGGAGTTFRIILPATNNSIEN